MSTGTRRQLGGLEVYLIATNQIDTEITIYGQTIPGPAGTQRRIRMPVDDLAHPAWNELLDRLVARELLVRIEGPGADLLEKLVQLSMEIPYTGGTGDRRVKVASNDAVAKYLGAAIIAGDGIRVEVVDDATYSKLVKISWIPSGRVHSVAAPDQPSAKNFLMPDANSCRVTGSATIEGISLEGWYDGDEITLHFLSAIKLVNLGSPDSGFGVLRLPYNGDLDAKANTIVKFRKQGTEWWTCATPVFQSFE